MLSMLKQWTGTVEMDDKVYTTDQFITNFNPTMEKIHIVLHAASKNNNTTGDNHVEEVEAKQEYRITVKKYMTQKADPRFDFMEKWNHNNPMPLRTMTGWIEKQTRGMVYMHLHGDIWQEKICTCMCCGRTLTNPVSQYFGIGPECGGHNYVNPFNSDEELKEAVEDYKAKLQATTWEGWIIKSAITEQEEV